MASAVQDGEAAHEEHAAVERLAGLYWPAMFDPSPFDPATTGWGEGVPAEWIIKMWGEGTVADLIDRLDHGRDSDRVLAALRLGELCFGSSLSGTRFFPSPDKSERARMAEAVKQGRTGTRPRVLLPVLVRALGDPAPQVRRIVASVLMTIGPVAVEACPGLRQALKDEDAEVRGWSARALYSIDNDVLNSVEASVALLDHDEPGIRGMAACNLELMGEDAYASIPFLEKRLADPDPEVRRGAESALRAIRK